MMMMVMVMMMMVMNGDAIYIYVLFFQTIQHTQSRELFLEPTACFGAIIGTETALVGARLSCGSKVITGLHDLHLPNNALVAFLSFPEDSKIRG